MDHISDIDKLELIKSFQSTIRKLEKSLDTMTKKGANTTLVKKRLSANNIGLAILENVWNQRPHQYTQEDFTEARNVLIGLFPSIKNSYTKLKEGSSPQRTLLERRIKALELAIQGIDELTDE